MALFLREADVDALVTIDDAIEAAESAFRALAEGRAHNTPRQRPRIPGAMLQTMSAAIDGVGLGLKAYSVTSQGVRFVVLLWEPESGDLLAMIEADRLGVMRTGAASAVATRRLATSGSHRIGLFGSGHQAFSQLAAINSVVNTREVRVYSPTEEHRRALAARARDELGVKAHAVDHPEAAADGAGVVVTITNAKEPVLRREWLAPGAHINAAGSNRASARELDPETVAAAECIACDSIEQCAVEAGDLLEPGRDAEARRAPYSWHASVDPNRLIELSELIAGRAAGRTGDDQITIFESTGLAVQDVALARTVYDRAWADGRGEEMPATIL